MFRLFIILLYTVEVLTIQLIMNKILCFDVSGNSCSVAVSFGQEIVSFEQELRPSMQAERLMVIVQDVLLSARLKYKELDYLAVTTGPGSFTGVRIGLAAAKGIIHASGIKPIGITNFEAAYYRLKQQVLDFENAVIILDAYRSQQYVQVFGHGGYKSNPKLIDNKDIRHFINSYPGMSICAGSGLAAIYNEIKDLSKLIILPRFKTIKAYHIARLADNMINSRQGNPIEPLYIRPPDATPSV
jgi:tRNA threonylcarbamoyladenosine biosynthesis protein TsaB